MTGVAMTHVPFKGDGPAMVALLGGEIQLYPPEAFQKFVDAEIAKWTKVVKAGNIRVESPFGK